MTNTMKLSPETLSILKNFSEINKNILFRKGNVISVIGESKSVIAWATVPETFDREFGIADLRKFLATLSMFQEPELEFNDKTVIITEGKRRVSYVLAAPKHILSVEAEVVQKINTIIDQGGAEFPLTNETFAATKKALQILNLPEFEVVGDGETVTLKGVDTSSPTSDAYSVAIGDTSETFKAVFKAENLKFLPLDYRAKYSPKGFARFASDRVSYLVSMEVRKR